MGGDRHESGEGLTYPQNVRTVSTRRVLETHLRASSDIPDSGGIGDTILCINYFF